MASQALVVDQVKLRRLERTLGRLPEKIAQKVFRKAGRKAAVPIVRAAKARVQSQFQEQTGKLARGIKVQIRLKGLGVRGSYMRVKIGLSPVGRSVAKEQSVFYGRFLEVGTKKFTARPFLEPAFEARQGEALRIFQSELRKGIDGAVRDARR